MRRILLGAVGILAGGFISAASPALATTWSVVSGNTPFTDDNVIDNACVGNAVGPATFIQGCLNTSHTTLVDFTSDENIEFAAGGQAKIVAEDGDYSRLTINLDSGLNFQTLILNIEANGDGKVVFSSPGQSDVTMDLSGNGNNFFSISGADFSSISFLTENTQITEIDLTDDVKQVRIGVNGITDVPEPASLALLGSALLGFGLIQHLVSYATLVRCVPCAMRADRQALDGNDFRDPINHACRKPGYLAANAPTNCAMSAVSLPVCIEEAAAPPIVDLAL